MGLGKGEDISRLRRRISDIHIGIRIDDFSLLHDLIDVGRAMDLKMTIMGDDDQADPSLDCVVINPNDDTEHVKSPYGTVINAMDDAVGSMERCVLAAMDRYRPERLLVGVDPGKRPGMAFFADGKLVSVYKASGDENVLDRIVLMDEASEPSSCLVRLGDGAPGSRDRILSLLRKNDYPTEIVDERRTTTAKRFRDEVAAISIAQTRGERAHPEYPSG